jgi:hypothetical protein
MWVACGVVCGAEGPPFAVFAFADGPWLLFADGPWLPFAVGPDACVPFAVGPEACVPLADAPPGFDGDDAGLDGAFGAGLLLLCAIIVTGASNRTAHVSKRIP